MPEPWPSRAVRSVLRSPDLKPLHDEHGRGFRTEDGRWFPISDGILCLLQQEERGADLGDARFYEDHPFGERDWTNPRAVEAGVEPELKDLLHRYPKSSLIADVGSGTGRISNYLGFLLYENVVSLDFSRAALRQVTAHSANTCIWGNNLQLPLADGSFDLVISSGVAHHTPDPRKAVEECIRILKPGGRLYLRVYNRQSPYRCVYDTYGALLRALYSKRATGRVADVLGFKFYRWVRRVLFSRQDEAERVLRAKFGNLFLKRMVYFFQQSEIEALLAEHRMTVESGSRQGVTHRMHCYVACKPA